MRTSRWFHAPSNACTVRSHPAARPRRLLPVAALAAGITLVAGACSGSASTSQATGTTTATSQPDVARTFDIGGREMYLQCTGQGSPTVILISGGGIAADAWDSPLGEQPTVYPTIAGTTRVCAYDRPGTTRARAEGGISRSDPVPQPVTPSASVADLHALIDAAGLSGPFVLAAHSYGGLVARLFAHEHPSEVAGLVLVDSFSPELREAMPEQWPAWIRWNTTPAAIVQDYPDYERVDFDKALDEIVANRSITPMPLVVLTADEPYPAPTQPGIPGDINVVTRTAQDVSQRQVAQLVPGAEHITETHSGHDIMLDNPVLVSDAVLDVVAAVRAGRTTASVTPPAAEHAEVELTPVIQSVPSPPRWYPGGDGRFHLQYELMLTNTVPLPVEVASVEVLGDGRSIDVLTGDVLGAAMSRLGNETGSTNELAAASVGVVWLDLSFASKDQIPRRVSHVVTVDVGPGLPVGPVITDAGPATDVATEEPVVIEPPLQGGRWVAVGGPTGPHRRALQAVNGSLRLGQRFAVDFAALLDGEGRTHRGSADRSSSYFNDGEPVLAVGAGTVVEAVDGRPDQIPNRNTPVPLSEAGGNEVILQLDSGAYVGYGHLRPGSLRVRAGQRVRAGEVLGLLGNSGQSSGPHLHLQVMTDPSFLATDGLPFVITGFRLEGSVPSLEELLDADRAGTPMPIDASLAGDRRQQGVTGLDVVTFPGR